MAIQLTKDDVKGTVLSLLEDEDTVTSLEVKNELRNDGFWAVQSEVSNFLKELVEEDVLDAYEAPDWMFFSGSAYNYYVLHEADDNNVTATTVQSVTDDVPEAKVAQNPGSGDWLLFQYGNAGGLILFIEGDTSRNKARAYYEKETRVPYAKVGCSRVK